MVIIVEGLDGVGKTTFSKQFAEKYNFTYIKESYTDDCKEKENRILLMLQRLLSNENYIYDRTTLIDDFVYSFLNKKQSTLLKYKGVILSILSQCYIFHLTVDEKTRQQRFNQRGDQYVTNNMIQQIADYYNLFYTNLNNVHIFELSQDLNENVKRLMEEIKNDTSLSYHTK